MNTSLFAVLITLLMISFDCSVESASGSGQSESDTCIGTPYNGSICTKEFLDLQSCITGFQPTGEIMILNQNPSSVADEFFLILISFLRANPECANAAMSYACLEYYGLCDASGIPYRGPFSYCENISTGVCAQEWKTLTSVFPLLTCNSSLKGDENSVDDKCFMQTTETTETTETSEETEGFLGLSVLENIILCVFVSIAFVILVVATAAVIVICVLNKRRSTVTARLKTSKGELKSIDNANYVNGCCNSSYDEVELMTRNQRISRAEPNGYFESQIISNQIQETSPLPYEEAVIIGANNTVQDEEDLEEDDSSDGSYENSLTDSDSYVQQVVNDIEGHYEVQSEFWHPASEHDELKIQFSKLKLPVIMEDDVNILEQLGSGQFGSVHRGVWHHSDHDDNSVRDEEVAVKTMKVGASEEERVKFLQEAIIMGQFNNPQVLRILGVITMRDDLQIVMELMHNGDLRSHLQSLKPGSGEPVPAELAPTLLSYSRQVACGLIYFSMKNFIHRDLAARNVLVSACGMCKIADFGLSRDLHDEDYYTSHGGKIPVKWTAPEALSYRKYSTKSDMWSFGCVLYEIWSLGCKPFHDVSNMEVVKKLETRYRLPPPPGCPRLVYHTMIKCWHPVPDSRPTAGAAVASLSHPDFQIFNWSPKDIANNSEEARTLGATIEEGHTLYKDLQKTYRRPESSRKRSKKHALQKIQRPA